MVAILVAIVGLVLVIGCSGPVTMGIEEIAAEVTSELTTITVKVVDQEDNQSLFGARVTCLTGCQSQASEVTDAEGHVVFGGQLPLMIRVEMEGYTSIETEIRQNGSVIALSYVWTQITVRVVLPYFDGSKVVFPGLPGVSVTCLLGCDQQPTKPTNNDGLVSFRGTNPITARFEKSGHVPRELMVSNGERVFLGHEWPPESAKSFRMLRIPEGTVLNWGVEGREAGSNFACISNTGSVPVITVVRHTRERMLHVMEHELFHGHQYEYGPDSGPSADKCNLKPWRDSEEGQAWEAAQNADRDAGRRVPLDDYVDKIRPTRKATEGSAEFWAWWRRAEPGHQSQVRDLCKIATARCALMEQWFGPRPTNYP